MMPSSRMMFLLFSEVGYRRPSHLVLHRTSPVGAVEEGRACPGT